MARIGSLVFAVVIFAATVWALGNVGFIQLLLVGGIGSTALVGPFALSLFWSRASSAGFISGIVASQIITGLLLAVSFEVVSPAGLPVLKLWEVMAVGHVASTTITVAVSAAKPVDFDFNEVAQEPAIADGGEGE